MPAKGPRLKLFFPALLALLAGCTTVETQIEINAPAKEVSSILYDFADYPKWNPFIFRIDGAVEEGKHAYINVRPVGMPEIAADILVLSTSEDHLSWSGTGLAQAGSGSLAVGAPGILGGTHDFIIEAQGPNKTLFLNTMKFSGAAVPFYNFNAMEEAGLKAMNEALKERAERNWISRALHLP